MSSNSNSKAQLANSEQLLADYKDGKMVILVDDEERENEGDLLVAAECVTAEHINFMAAHGRGLICLALSEARCKQLDLALMVHRNNARFSTNFTVSIEAAHGVTTGISARDRATTVRVAVKKDATPKDLATPGHIFPIKAQPGGVLTRAGHTEAGIDLARISGFEPASVICEILNPDGTMARLDDLLGFAKQHDIQIGSIADLIRYRMQNDPTVQRISESVLQLHHTKFKSYVYRDMVEGSVHMALAHGDIKTDEPVLVRVHVHRGLLDILLQPNAPWSWNLEKVVATIAAQNSGIIVLLDYDESAQELAERVNLQSKINAARQDKIENEVDDKFAKADLEADDDLRMLGAGGQILADLGVSKMLALGRKKRAHGLSGFGLEVVDYISDEKQLAKWLLKNKINR